MSENFIMSLCDNGISFEHFQESAKHVYGVFNNFTIDYDMKYQSIVFTDSKDSKCVPFAVQNNNNMTIIMLYDIVAQNVKYTLLILALSSSIIEITIMSAYETMFVWRFNNRCLAYFRSSEFDTKFNLIHTLGRFSNYIDYSTEVIDLSNADDRQILYYGNFLHKKRLGPLDKIVKNFVTFRRTIIDYLSEYILTDFGVLKMILEYSSSLL